MQETIQKPKNEVVINLTGEYASPFEKILVPEDAYDLVITKIELKEAQSFKSPQVLEKKFVFTMHSPEKKFDLAMFVSPVISKGSGTFSNSKLFDILEKAGLLEVVEHEKDSIASFEDLQLFLSRNLVNKRVRASVKTSNKKSDNPYSRVSDVLRFI